MKDYLNNFFNGRYGMDRLNHFLACMYFVLILLFSFFKNQGIYLLSTITLVILLFRMLSKDIYKRSSENSKFIEISRPLVKHINNLKTPFVKSFNTNKQKFSQRKTHCFYSCPGCEQTIRVPKGKGKIQIRCPKCGATFIKTT